MPVPPQKPPTAAPSQGKAINPGTTSINMAAPFSAAM